MEPEAGNYFDDLFDAVDDLGEKLDHLHEDVRALRAHLGIPRPECYPLEIHDEGRAERAREE